MAEVNKDDLDKGAKNLDAKRASLMTLLLLQLQPVPEVRRRLPGDDVFGFEEQEAELAAQLLVPGRQVLWLHGMGECLWGIAGACVLWSAWCSDMCADAWSCECQVQHVMHAGALTLLLLPVLHQHQHSVTRLRT